MNDAEINDLVASVLRQKFSDFESSTAVSETDFDGTPIIRVNATYADSSVPSDARIEAIHDLRNALLAKGDERFVFLVNHYPDDETIEEDVE